MNHGRLQLADGELREPKKKKVKPGTLLRDPYPIIFWNKLGIPPCKELWPGYMGVFDGDSVMVDDPGDMHEISTMGYFGKRFLCRRGYEQSVGDVPVVRERHWKRRVEWAAECGYILVPPDKESGSGSPQKNVASDSPEGRVAEGGGAPDVESEVLPGDGSGNKESEGRVTMNGCHREKPDVEGAVCVVEEHGAVVQGIVGEGGAPGLSKPGTSEDSAQLDKNSSAVIPESHPEGEQQQEKGCGSDAPVHCAAPGKERVVKQAEGGSASDGRDEAAALGKEGEGDSDGILEARQEGVGDVHLCEGGSGVESSTDGPPSEGDQVDGGGKSSAASSSEVEGESKKSCEGGGSETGPMEVDAEEGAEAAGGEEGARSSQVMKGSPSELNESARDSLEGEDSSRGGKSANSSCAKRSLEKSLVSDGASKALDVIEGSGSAQTLEGAKLEGGEPLVVGSVRMGEEEGLGSVSEAVKEEPEGGVREEEVECGAKSGGEGEVTLGKTCGEVDGDKAKEEDSGKTHKGSDGQRDSRGDHRKERGGKRSRSPDLGSNSPGGKTAGGEGEVSEDACEAPAKKVKCDEESKGGGEEGRQKEEVTVRMTRGEGSGMGGDGMGHEDEPELAEAAIDETGRSSSAKRNREEEDEEMKELPQGERSVQETSKRSSLNKSSSDCEIVEIEDESSTQNPILSVSKRPSDRVRTPLLFDRSKNSIKKGTHSPAVHDSHDDIVEMIVEEEEVHEVSSDGGTIVGRRRGSRNMMREGITGHKNNAADGKSETESFRKKLRAVPNALSGNTEEKLTNSGEEEGKGCQEDPMGNSGNDIDDDDVIEINLPKSDMMELEECVEGDGEVECGRGGQAGGRARQRRIHKESSGFRRRTLVEEPARAEVEVVDGVESTTTGNLGSDCCEVAPCIVIPDSDSEPEETQESPRLESDPSIFLPSLDALQLIPEEAFFLAYGLGCLMVWDGRNSDLLPSQFEDDKDGEDDSVLIDETLSSDSHSSGAVKKGNDVSKMEDNAPSSSMKQNGEGCPHDDSSTTSDCGADGSSKSKKRCDLGYHSGSPSKGSITLMTIEEDENVVVDPSKVASEKDPASKSPVRELEEPPAASDGRTHSPSMKDPSGEASEEGPCAGDTPDSVGKTSSVTQGCESVEGISALGVKSTADEVPVNACDQQNKNDSTSRIGDSLSIVYDAGSDGKTSSQSRKHKYRAGEGDGDKTMPCSPHQSGEISDPDDTPLKENGDLDSSSITIIDLADSPPHSRQWSRKGWSSHEEEDVAVVDVDVQPSVPDHPNERMLSNKYQRPMSILELWNAFRSCRASIPSPTVPFETSYAVYHHFRSKRWVVKPGLRFGGDFLLYKDGPPFYHASYLVVIDSFDADGESKFDWKMLSGMNRLTENIAKDLMLCRVEWPSTITEGDLRSPECLSGVVVQEVLVRRWVSIRERDADQLDDKDDDDRDSFIPLKL